MCTVMHFQKGQDIPEGLKKKSAAHIIDRAL